MNKRKSEIKKRGKTTKLIPIKCNPFCEDVIAWKKLCEIDKQKILGELHSSNYRVALKQLFLFYEYLEKEKIWVEEVLNTILQGVNNEDEAQQTINEWNSIFLSQN